MQLHRLKQAPLLPCPAATGFALTRRNCTPAAATYSARACTPPVQPRAGGQVQAKHMTWPAPLCLLPLLQVTSNDKIAWISEELCIGCGICVKVRRRQLPCAACRLCPGCVPGVCCLLPLHCWSPAPNAQRRHGPQLHWQLAIRCGASCCIHAIGENATVAAAIAMPQEGRVCPTAPLWSSPRLPACPLVCLLKRRSAPLTPS